MKKALFTLALTLVAFTGNAQLVINGDLNYDGDLNITDVMKMVDIILGNSPKSYLTCPDDNHPHLIDLGLPSGTKWACCNVGAIKPHYYGNYYAWGETEKKYVFNDVTYLYSTGVDEDGDGFYDDWHSDTETYGVWQDIGSDIAGTQYDVAHVKWGGSWVMPSKEQIEELRNNCTFKGASVNEEIGDLFISKINGASIYLPMAGYFSGGNLYNDGLDAMYWSSTLYSTYPESVYYLYFGQGYTPCIGNDRSQGRSVRPVSR